MPIYLVLLAIKARSSLEFTNKKGDKVTISGRGVISADGKTRTVTINGTDSKGKKFTSTAIYDKQ